ncbi:MAG: hypothetical protein RSB38_08260 [Oscillospiraceae bacterium]
MIKNKAFRRIFSSFFVITIIYTVVVSGLFFIKDKNATETLLNNSRDAYVTEVKNKMDMQFDLVLRLATQIEQESDFKEYIIGTDENPYIMTKVYQKIVSSVNIFGNIPCMVGVIKNGSDTVITESNTQKLDDYLSEKGLENSLETINTHLLSQSVSGAYYVPLDTKDDIINIAYIKSFSENAYATIILSFYPEDIIPEAIDGGLIIMNKSDLIYESADNILSSESAKKILEDEKVEDLFKKDGMLYRYVTSSTLFDWKYVFALSEKSGIGNLLFVSILIFVVFIFLGLWLAFFESKKIYSPIKKIAGLLNQNNDIVDDEFSYIQEKLTTVLNSNKAESLKGKFLVDVINGFLNHDKIEEGIITYHLENLNSPLNIVIFTFDNYELLAENYSGGSVNDIRNLLFSSIQMQLKTCCSSEIAESDYKSFEMYAQNIDMEKFEKNIDDIAMRLSNHIQKQALEQLDTERSLLQENSKLPEWKAIFESLVSKA